MKPDGDSFAGALKAEFDHEARVTRRHLERLPEDKLEWRPHVRSFTARDLASHIVECVQWTDAIFTRDELDMDPKTYQPYRAAAVAELLAAFDASVAKGRQAMAGATDRDMLEPWRFKIMGKPRFEKTRAAVLRDFTLSHLIHHRGQLSVYLRLLDVPVPGSYGPTADER